MPIIFKTFADVYVNNRNSKSRRISTRQNGAKEKTAILRFIWVFFHQNNLAVQLHLEPFQRLSFALYTENIEKIQN